MRFRLVFENTEEGVYTVYVPDLLGCITEGKTKKEALKKIKKEIELYIAPTKFQVVLNGEEYAELVEK